jgi:hypothetical protein
VWLRRTKGDREREKLVLAVVCIFSALSPLLVSGNLSHTPPCLVALFVLFCFSRFYAPRGISKQQKNVLRRIPLVKAQN